jgi:signal transduction histidine kinase
VRTSQLIKRQYQRIEQRALQQYRRANPHCRNCQLPPHFRILDQDLSSIKRRIVIQLLIINLALSVIFAATGYFLSGQTLQPIKQALNEQKRFVSDAAHELRTPLTALKTCLEVNLMGNKRNLSAHCRKILQDNLTDVQNLQNLVENLLTLARQEERILNYETFLVRKLVAQSVRQIKPLAEQKQIKLKTIIKPTELHLRADFTALKQVLIILLDNAIKYSPNQGEIVIATQDLSSSSGKNKIELNVTDQGPGIAEEHVPHIFKRFYQADAARSKQKQPGYGLGLAVARQIMKRHQGEIKVETRIGAGSCFSLVLPSGIS